MQSVIAFDVSKGNSYMVIYNAQRLCIYEGEILHNQSHFEKLYEQIVELVNIDGQVPAIVFEASGVYSWPLERFMKDYGFPYCLLNGLEAKLQMASMRIHKTDRNDAHQLAKTHYTAKRRIKTNQDEYYDRMRAYSRYYDELEGELGRLRGRLHALLQLTFPEMEKIFTDKSKLFLNILQLFPHAYLVKSLSKTIVRNRILANTNKRLSPKVAEKRAVQLIKAAQESYPAIDTNDIRCEQLKDYGARYLAIINKQEEIIREMVESSKERKEYKILTSIPGIGDNTAVRLIAEIGDITRFEDHKQLNAYAGIDIRRFQSGTILYKDKINKRGNSHLRKILFNTVQNVIRQRRFGHNHFVEYYDKLKTQPYNKPHKVASIACVNKLLKVAFHLITHNQAYDCEKATARS